MNVIFQIGDNNETMNTSVDKNTKNTKNTRKTKKTRAKRQKNDYVDKQKLTEEIVNLQNSKKLENNIKLTSEIQSGEAVKNLEEELKSLENKKSSEKKINAIKHQIEEIKSGAKLIELQKEYPELIKSGAVIGYSKQEFGKMVLLIINNLMKKHCFSGYTENWTEDFKSNAIYKIFRYIHNFDSERISEVTGKKVSSFAYLTQITYMAFLEVINKRKAENELMFKTMIPLQDVKLDYYTQDKTVNTSEMEHKEQQTEEDSITRLVIGNDELSELSLFEWLKSIREEHPEVEVTYPDNYSSAGNPEGVTSISIDEYNDIIALDFKILRLKKQVQTEELYDDTEEESACFIVQDDFDESWEWEEE